MSMNTRVLLASLLRLAWRGIDHHPGNDQCNDVLPCVCEHGGRGHILTWEQHLIQGQRSEIGLAHMQDQNKLYRGIEVRAEQPGVAGSGKGRLERVGPLVREW